MKKYKCRSVFALILFAVMTLINVSCDNNLDKGLEEYDTFLYFLNSDEVNINIYKTGVNTDYNITVFKAGNNEESQANATIEILTNEELAAYNTENNTNMIALPANCYTLNSSEAVLSKDKPYNLLSLTLKTELIENLEDVNGTYVVPLILRSDNKITEAKKHTFVVPTIKEPTVGFFTNSTQEYTFNDETTQNLKTTSELRIPEDVINLWDINCLVEVDETTVNDYNEQYNEDRSLLSSNFYTLTQPTFVKGEFKSNLQISVDKTNMLFGEYLLPVRIKSVSKPEFKIDNQAELCYVPITYEPPAPEEIPLTLDMLSSPHTEPRDGGSLPALIDGNPYSYWHSLWSTTEETVSEYGHYIDVDLKQEVTLFSFDYKSRHSANHVNPNIIELHVSDDGENWWLLKKIDKGLPLALGDSYSSRTFQSKKRFSHVRIAIIKASCGYMNKLPAACTALAELKVYGKLYE